MVLVLISFEVSVVAMGGPGGPCPSNDCLCPPILVYSEYVFGTSPNDETTGNNRKRNNNVQAFSFEGFSILCEIAGPQLLYINVMQIICLINMPLWMCPGIGV